MPAVTGTLVPTHSPFSGMPDEIMCEIILFDPDSVRVLRAVSRIFRESTEYFLQKNAEEILLSCPSHSSLANLIRQEFVSISTRLRAQPDRIYIQFHKVIGRLLHSSRILLPQEVNSRINPSSTKCLSYEHFVTH
jgi:hypothetical protein